MNIIKRSSEDAQEDFDLIVRLTDFTDPAQDDGRVISRESVEKFLDSDNYYNLINNRQMLGLLTHKGREVADQDTYVPYVDAILTHKDLCNVIVDTYIEGDYWLAKIKLIDGEAANRFRSILDAGVFCGVSVVMYVSNIDKPSEDYDLISLFGVDFTLDPAFKSSVIVKKMFSKRGKVSSGVLIQRSLPIKKSLNSYIRERGRPFHTFFDLRIKELIRHLRSIPKSSVIKNQDVIEDYILSALNQWWQRALKQEGTRLNIAMSLRINRWVKGSIITRFNFIANRIKTSFSKLGYFPQQEMKLFVEAYADLVKNLMSKIWEVSGRSRE